MIQNINDWNFSGIVREFDMPKKMGTLELAKECCQGRRLDAIDNVEYNYKN